MKTIYLDSDFKCHVTDDGTARAVETAAFDGRCDEYIEGNRFVPAGESWTREDGEVFTGCMIAPWKDEGELLAAQSSFDQGKITAYELLINELYEEVV